MAIIEGIMHALSAGNAVRKALGHDVGELGELAKARRYESLKEQTQEAGAQVPAAQSAGLEGDPPVDPDTDFLDSVADAVDWLLGLF